MNSELFFENKKYISSKRGSDLSGYNQDYIGQLIRDKKIEARRVGRQLFISLESLEKRLEKIKGRVDHSPSEESNPLFFEGKKFISSKDASDLSGYSRDYIGQLVREKKLEAKMVGRLWFISLLSLEKHLNKIKIPLVAEEPPTEVYQYETEEIKKISYPAFTLNLKTRISPFYQLKRTMVAAVIAITLIFGANIAHYELKKNTFAEGEPNILASASLLSASAFDSFAIDLYQYVNGKFLGAQKFFARLFGVSRLAYQTPIETPLPQTSPLGVVVVPKTADNEETLDRIKNSFSDKVDVSKNPDGISGIITPVFKKVSGDEYLYVLVPVKENKQ